jgi:hypothetical protein
MTGAPIDWEEDGPEAEPARTAPTSAMLRAELEQAHAHIARLTETLDDLLWRFTDTDHCVGVKYLRTDWVPESALDRWRVVAQHRLTS